MGDSGRMKRTVILAFLILLIVAPVSAQAQDTTTYLPIIMRPEDPAPSKIEQFDVILPWTGTTRTVLVYLPEGYNVIAYPVLYLSDAQNYIGEVGDVPFIMAGLEYDMTVRWDELSPWVNYQMPLWFGIPSPRGGLGDEYLSWIVNELKPIIDARYFTKPEREYTYIGGHSMGGFFSIYAGVARPNIFSKIIAFSPAVWFGSRDINNWLTKNNLIDYINAYYQGDMGFWIYVGGMESHDHECSISPCPAVGDYPTIYVQGATRLHELLGGEFVYNPTGTHLTSVFRSYFDEAVTWLESE